MREKKRCKDIEKALVRAYAQRRPVEAPPGWSRGVMRAARLAAAEGMEKENFVQPLFNRLALGVTAVALVAGVAMWGYLEFFGPDLEYKLVQSTLLAKGGILSWGLAL